MLCAIGFKKREMSLSGVDPQGRLCREVDTGTGFVSYLHPVKYSPSKKLNFFHSSSNIQLKSVNPYGCVLE